MSKLGFPVVYVLGGHFDRELAQMSAEQRSRVLDAIAKFSTTGEGNIETIKGEGGTYRLSKGGTNGFRIRFRFERRPEDGIRYMLVLGVKKRNDAYKRHARS